MKDLKVYLDDMKLVLEVTTEQQKQDVIEFAKHLNVNVEVLDFTEDEEDAAMIRAIDAGIQNDILSPAETADFLSRLGK
ncbi:MAG: hypothetical protein V5804_06165 [Mucilaginibacter sp.]|uniref:hypothetical protein n=1 Tax=Mucilaginibacter sp. TaxID=1882438 RepID=UPI0034E58AF9